MAEIVEEEEWNVDDCRGDHESDEHWELRRTFLLKHKGAFDKMKLLCLAQVFVNMEFLGCKYPKETMEKVNELSEGVIEEYRENKKGKLKRTFVKASEAAEKKTKGFKRSSNTNEYPDIANKLVVIDDSPSVGSENKLNFNINSTSASLVSQSLFSSRNYIKITDSKLVLFGEMNPSSGEVQQQQQQLGSSSSNTVLNLDSTATMSKTVVEQNTSSINVTDDVTKLKLVDKKYYLNPDTISKLNGFVLFRVKETDLPITVIQNSTTKWKGVSPIYSEEEVTTGFFKCSLLIIGETIAVSEGSVRKTAKHDVARKALKILGQYFYSVWVKKPFHSLKEYGRKDLDSFGLQTNQLATENFNAAPLGEENRGIKLLKSMGWSGGGLGKHGEGIQKPIETPSVVEFSRCGIGLSANTNVSGASFADKFKKFLEANMWQCFQDDHDLQFSNEFDSSERKIMHQVASSLNLSTKSYGREEDRYLVVSQKTQLSTIIQDVLSVGGENEKYKVILPGCRNANTTDTDLSSDSDDIS